MGRPRGGSTAPAAGRSSTNQLDTKSKAISKRTPGREKSAGKSYAEDSGSGSEPEFDTTKKQQKRASSPEEDFNASSEEEVVAAPTKPKASGGRGRPPAGSAAGSGGGAGKGSSRVAKDRAAVNRSYKEPEDSEEENFSEDKPSSPEMVPSDIEDSASDFDIDDNSSGSEYGKKSKKKKPAAAKKSPARKVGGKRGRKKAGSSSPKKRGRKPAAASPKSKNGRSKATAAKRKAPESGEDDEFDSNASESEEEYKAKAAGSSSSRSTKREATSSPRGARTSKPTPKRQNLDLADDEDDEAVFDELDAKNGSGSDFEEEDEKKPLVVKKKAAPANKKAPAKPKAPPKQPATPARSSSRATAAKKVSYADIEKSDEEEDERVLAKASNKRKAAAAAETKPKNNVAKPKVIQDDEEDEDDNDESSEVKEAGQSSSEEPETKKSKSEANSSTAASASAEESSEDQESAKDVVEAKKETGNGVKEATVSAADDKEDVSEEDEEEAAAAAPSSTNGGLKNRTDTDYETLDFTCDKKTEKGEPWNLKIASWNIGGVKSWLAKNGLKYLEKENPDIFCMQEIKSSEKTRPDSLNNIPNYPHCYWLYADLAGHHGVATFCKTKPVSVEYGLPIDEEIDTEKDKKLKKLFNAEGRLIITEFDKFYLLNTYVPNSGRGVTDDDHKKPYPARICNGERQAWNKYFQDLVKKLDAKKPVIVTGDLNVAHESIDLANPATNKSTAGFTEEEREGMTDLLEETGLCDSFRYLYSNKKDAYSFWSYRTGAREKNVGWRLDYFLVSAKLRDGLCESTMRSEVYGSDHCPIVVCAHV